LKPFDTNGVFNPTSTGAGGLRQLAVRGAGVTLLSGGVGLGVQIIATAVLARLIAPRDFGLVTMVTTFSLLLVNFGLNGLTEAVVQREVIDHRLASSLFWINVGAGTLLTFGFAAASSLLARFYHDAHVARVAVGISVTILITSASVMHLALMKRAMRFREISANDVCARIVAATVSILLGWAGWGYWALVIGAAALPLSTTIGAWYLCPWLPGFPRREAGTRSVLAFAVHTYGRFTVNYFARNTDNLLVGWRFSAQSLGFYKKAYDLFALSTNQLVSSLSVVVVATLSRVNRDAEQYRRYVLGAFTVAAFVGMGLAAALTLVGKDLIRILLGPGWEPSGQIFMYFGPGIGIMMLYYTHGWIHLSIGRADRWFRWGILEFVVTCLFFVAGLPWGPVGIAIAWTTSFWVLTVPALWYAGRPIRFGVRPILAVVWRYIVAALLAGVATSLVIRNIGVLADAQGAGGAVARLVAISLLLTIMYLGAVVIFHGGFAPLEQMAGLLGEMVQRGRSSDLSPVSNATQASAMAAAESKQDGSPIRSDSRDEPLVSILIPAHNAEEWITETIRSAMAQVWERKEIIVVDDGSTDRTFEVAKRFESESVHVVRQNNQGAAAARNHAFSLSQGRYIQWLDADDLLAPDKIARQMAVAQRHPNERTLISGGFGKFRYRWYRAEFVPTALWSDLSPAEWLLIKMEQNLYMQTATWLVSRELSQTAGPWDIRMLGDDDGEYFCRVLLASDGVRFVPEANVYYRTFGFNSLSYVGKSEKKREALWSSMQLHVKYLLSLEDTPRARAACAAYLQRNLIYFYPERQDIVEHADQMTRQMGHQLNVPSLSWKYSWARALFGWHVAKRVSLVFRKTRWGFMKSLDKILFRLENRPLPTLGGRPSASTTRSQLVTRPQPRL
jgi:O-antigen/teichoic acid export membrane protein/glycosyltransferase involved in cell wall biosynthesis